MNHLITVRLLLLWAASIHAEANNFILTSNQLNDEVVPVLSNGRLSFIAYDDSIYLNGVYNGAGTESRRARIPNYGRVQFDYCGVSNQTIRQCEYSLNVRQAVFETVSKFRSNAISVQLKTYAHRVYERSIVNQLKIQRIGVDADSSAFLVRLFASPGSYSDDLNLTRQHSNTIDGFNYVVYELSATTPENATYQATDETIRVFAVAQNVPEYVILPAAQNELTVMWITTIGLDRENALAELREVWSKGVDELLAVHVNEWERFWTESGITVVGNDELAQVIHSSLYDLASILPSLAPSNRKPNEFFGLTTAAIGSDLHKGHATDDIELWVQPPALLLEPLWSERLLAYRFSKRAAAFDKAAQYGYQGVLYPVRSGFTGVELSADENEAALKHHISADVAFAVKQHLAATLDLDWFQQVGCGIAYQTAGFWVNRTVFNNHTGRFDIQGVIGPDNSLISQTNNAYTNVAAALNLFFAEFALCLCKTLPNPPEKNSLFLRARSIELTYLNETDHTPTFDGFQSNTTVQKADTILLSYPLRYPLDESTQLNNLRIFESNVRGNVPSTTYAVQNIIRLQLSQQPSSAQFDQTFKPYVRGPFKQWTLSAYTTADDAVVRNNIVGAGGFLQQIINGYAGVRLFDNHLEISNTTLPPGTTRLALNGIKYLNGVYAITVTPTDIWVTVKKRDANTDIVVNGIVQVSGVELYTLPRLRTVFRLQPKNNGFGQCKYEFSTIGHRSSGSTIVASTALLILTLIAYSTI